jgi:hypothetical protein
MFQCFENSSELSSGNPITRRSCLRFLMGVGGLFLAMPLSIARAAGNTKHRTIVDRFRGEELIYQIGFWLISHCGDANTSFLKTDLHGIYRTSLEGRTVGFIDFLMGRLRYSYVSYSQYLADEDRLRPVVFQINKRRMGKESRRSVIFNYATKEIIFSKTAANKETKAHGEPMLQDRIYEDYLTLFYNFRHGCYGPLKRDRIYRLPLYIRKKMKSLALQIVSFEEQKKNLKKESNKANKDFFLQFQVSRQDVSSGSGEVAGWLSSKAIPVKGTIKDVIFFGDLWGELIETRIGDPSEIAVIPDFVKNQIQLP